MRFNAFRLGSFPGFSKGAVFLMCALMGGLCFAQAAPAPPEEVLDEGVCPRDDCEYGRAYLVRLPIQVYAEPPKKLGAPDSSLDKKSLLQPDTWVTSETGLVLARKHAGRMASTQSERKAGKGGEDLWLYTYLGDGCWRAWTDGKLTEICNAQSVEQNPQQEWWIQVRLQDDTQGWLLESSPGLVSDEELGKELKQSTRKQDDNQWKWGIVMGDNVRLRGRPSARGEIIGTVNTGMRLQLVNEAQAEAAWVQVVNPLGRKPATAWVSTQYVRIMAPAGPKH